MTKKDYISIANALKPLYDQWYSTGDSGEAIWINDIINNIVKVLKDENPRFDSIKFLNYLRGYK